MPRLPIFVLIADKMERARAEVARLDSYLENYSRAGFDDVWSRTATIAFTIHGVYTAMEDVMSDIANGIDFHVHAGEVCWISGETPETWWKVSTFLRCECDAAVYNEDVVLSRRCYSSRCFVQELG